MTKKQIKAVNNLLTFIDSGYACLGFSEQWHKKLDYLNKHKSEIIKLSPTCQETQNIFNFLIKSMKQAEQGNSFLKWAM